MLGVLHIGTFTAAFTTEEALLLQLAADRAAIAIEQRTLLRAAPAGGGAAAAPAADRLLSGTGGLQLAGRYLPASRESLGGDWYDAFVIAGGKVVVAIGDVVGHGIPAAAVMAQLRTALRAYAVEGHAPGRGAGAGEHA